MDNEAAGRQSKMAASPDQPDFKWVMSVCQWLVDDPVPAEIGDGRWNKRDTEPARHKTDHRLHLDGLLGDARRKSGSSRQSGDFIV
jgi:hypothetical protein